MAHPLCWLCLFVVLASVALLGSNSSLQPWFGSSWRCTLIVCLSDHRILYKSRVTHHLYKTCFKLTGKEECCVYFKPTSVTLSNDKSLLQARQARQDQGRQRCPAGIAQVSSDAFSEFVRSSAAIVRQWAIGHWISQQLSFLCSSSIPIVQPNRKFKN